jgi:hypothetical protein
VIRSLEEELKRLKDREQQALESHGSERLSSEAHIRGLSAELHECRQALEEAKAERKSALADLRLAHLDSSRAQQAVANLRKVLEQFERDKLRELEALRQANDASREELLAQSQKEVGGHARASRAVTAFLLSGDRRPAGMQCSVQGTGAANA